MINVSIKNEKIKRYFASISPNQFTGCQELQSFGKFTDMKGISQGFRWVDM